MLQKWNHIENIKKMLYNAFIDKEEKKLQE
jgi:hypothetical protein